MASSNFSSNKLPVLVTGANRGLGLKICAALSNSYDIYATARNVEALEEAFEQNNIELKKGYELDLSVAEDSVINNIFAASPKFYAVIHCASPYIPKKFKENSFDELAILGRCSISDQYLLKKSAENLISRQGCLLVTGSIIGVPDWYGLGAMGIYKNNLRQLCGVLSHEYQDGISVIHLNLGAIRDAVSDQCKQSQTKSQDVVSVVNKILKNPLGFSKNINLVSSAEEKIFSLKSHLETIED